MLNSSKDDHVIKTALYEGKKVSIEETLKLKNKANENSSAKENASEFVCETCGEKLLAHEEGIIPPDRQLQRHFEHTAYKDEMATCSKRNSRSNGHQVGL